MRNTLGDLQNHLFMALERLGDEDLSGEKLQEEMNRAKAVSDVASQIIANGSLVLKAQVLMDNRLNAETRLPKMLEG